MLQVLPFFLSYLFPLNMMLGHVTNAPWIFRMEGWILLTVFVLDEIVGPDTRTPTEARADANDYNFIWRLALWLWVPVQATLIVCGIIAVTQDSLTRGERINLFVLLGTGVGLMGGAFGITVAHELMHRSGRFERALAEILMTMVSYTHFCIEHVHGHHGNVGTTKDPATALLGESLYTFYPRTIFGGLASAWKLETTCLRRRGGRASIFRNRMLRYLTTLIITYTVIGTAFGGLGVAFFGMQSVIAFSMLEVINYIQHYGLIRHELAPGRYERVSPGLSWNSSYRVGNWLLFNLTRHSDHHCRPRHCYPVLRHCHDAPQLPANYFSMFVLALFPPLWFRVMDPRVQAWRGEPEIAIAPVQPQIVKWFGIVTGLVVLLIDQLL